MQPRYIHTSFEVLAAYACFFEYGDTTGLEPGEVTRLESFTAAESDGNPASWYVDSDTGDSAFGRCEASGNRGTLCTVVMMQPNPEFKP